MQQVFVTGGSGFIGRHLVRALTDQGIHCRCLVRRSSDVRHLQRPEVERVYGAIDDAQTYADALRGCDCVFHLAGLTHAVDRSSLFRINAEACGMLADACVTAGVPRLVYLSSLAAAGPPPSGKPVRDESDPPLPISDYGRSKLQGEMAFRARAAQLATTVLRPGVVYGTHDSSLRQLINTLSTLRLHIVIGFRTPALSLIHVDDLVRLMSLAATQGEALPHGDADGADRATGIYFAVDDSEYVNYADFGRRIARASGHRVLVWPLWRWVGMTVGWSAQRYQRLRGRSSLVNVDKVREATAASWAASGEKARRQLGFTPSHPLDAYLPEMTRWYTSKAVDLSDSAGPAD